MDIKSLIREAVDVKNAFVEVRLEQTETNYVLLRSKEIERVASNVDLGGFVRALVPGFGWGVATFNSITELPKRVKEAIALSRSIIPEEKLLLAPIEPVNVVVKDNLTDDFRHHSLNEKKELVVNYNSIIRGYSDSIIDSSVTYADSFRKGWYANSDGSLIERERADCLVSFSAIARSGNDVQMAHDSRSSRNSFGELLGLDSKVKDTAKIAVGLLSAPTVKGGTYTVILDQNLAGVFVHEAFGHLSEADHIYENPQALEMMKLGKRFGTNELNISEDGSIKDLRGSIYYDDEGVKCRKNYLVKDGILVGRLHNRETAKKLDEKVTGNARAQDYSHIPIVRMTNTFIEQGTVSFDDMIADVDDGIYACYAYGGQTALENFSFSAGYAYKIEKGKITNLIRNVILQGNLFVTLKNIDAIGNDFQWIKSGGECGKGGQGVPVGMGSPSIRIRNVLIGGK